MIQNYLKIAFRNLIRHKGYTAINILGLAIGLACFMIITMYVREELSYDQWHENGDRIYRVALERKYPGRTRNYAIIPHSYAAAMVNEYPEVEEACRLLYFPNNPIIIKKDEIVYEEENYMWADSNFFNFFDIELVRGNPTEVLINPNSVVLTQTMADKYFPNEDPIGKVLDMTQNNNDLLVTGVCEDIPTNSHMGFDMLMSSKSLNFLQNLNYISFSSHTYLMLSPNADPKGLESKFPDLVVKYASGQILNNFGVNYEEYQSQGNGYAYSLMSMPDIYLNSKLEGELKPPGSKQRVYFFLIIAILILVIACINFMNLATARSAGRAKEVGIRKTLGSERKQIALQFFVEAVLISVISAIVACVIFGLCVPAFNDLTGKSFQPADLIRGQNLILLIGLTAITGLLSGSYPALALSSFKPIAVLRGHFSKTGKGARLRNALVVFQFGISVFLIICTMLVYKQMLFTQNKALGFDKDQLITLQGAGGMTFQQEETFKDEIARIPGVQAVSGCSTQPGGFYFGVSFKPPEETEMTTGSGLVVDDGYIECMKMNIVEGRSFSEEFFDSLSVVINEAAVREMGLEDPIGTKLVDGFGKCQVPGAYAHQVVD